MSDTLRRHIQQLIQQHTRILGRIDAVREEADPVWSATEYAFHTGARYAATTILEDLEALDLGVSYWPGVRLLVHGDEGRDSRRPDTT